MGLGDVGSALALGFSHLSAAKMRQDEVLKVMDALSYTMGPLGTLQCSGSQALL